MQATSEIAERISSISVSSTLKVSADADRLRREGADVVDFGAGEPDFPTPANIKQAAVEAKEAVTWSKPADLYYEPGQPLPKLGGHFSQGFLVALGDASVRMIDPRVVTENTLRLAITADDGQVLGPDW